MPRSMFLGAVALVTLAGFGACTQDFHQFEPDRSNGAGGSGASLPSGGGGGGASSTTTTTTMSTSSGASGGEHCLNGQDDDSDGDVDCDDESCSDFSCVGIPVGWQGPGILYLSEGSPAPMPACPDAFPTLHEVGGTDIDASARCSPCACGEPDVTCVPSELTAYLNNDCGGPSASTLQPSPGVCSPLFGGFAIESYSAEPPDIDSGPCAPSQTSLEGPPPSFGTQGRICAVAAGSGGCPMGATCAPLRVEPPFQNAVCIWRDGERSCPNGFDERRVFAEALVDDRRCSACACGTPLVSCGVTTVIYADASCETLADVVLNDGSCAFDAPPGMALSVELAGAGSCTPSGGMLLGDVEQVAQTTVCCRP